MKKHFYLIFAILFLAVVSFGIISGTASAEEQYSKDYFILKNGQFQSEEEIFGIVFSNGVDLIVDNAKVSSQLAEDFNHNQCAGASTFKLNGSRDIESGDIKGTFIITIKGTCPAIIKEPFSLTANGTFTGYAIFATDQYDKTIGTAKGQIINTITTASVVINGITTPMPPTGSININFPGIEIEGLIDDSGARFSGMTGQVEWRADDDPDGWKLCDLDTVLPVYAHVRTQEDSSAILSFKDMSTFVLKADSEVVIDTPPEKESKIKLVAGNIWVNVKKMINEGSFEIEMNQAVCGIKGTTFVLSDDGKTSTLQVIEGEVSFTSKANGKKVDVVAGSMVSASSAGLGGVETFDTAKVTADWDIVVSGDAKEATDFTSNGFLFLYGLIGVIAIFIVVIIIRKIKR